MKFDVNYLNLDFASFSSHKIYGPQGIGGLFIKKRKDIKITPLLSGGGQENGLRSGTLSTSYAPRLLRNLIVSLACLALARG